MTTSRRSHSRAPMRRSSGPERILSAGLATATCIGVVGLLGARTIEANASSSDAPATSEASSTDSTLAADSAGATAPATTSTGLTQSDLDAYAAELAAEAARLDAYRAKLVKTAKRLKRLAAAQAAPVGTSPARSAAAPVTDDQGTSRPSAPTSPKTAKPRPQKQAAQPAPQQQAAQPAPQQQAAQPAPKAAPAAQPAPQQQAAQPAAKPQSNTKSS